MGRWKTKSEAWYFQCEQCGKRGCYVGTYEGVATRLHTGRRFASKEPCNGKIRITGRRT